MDGPQQAIQQLNTVLAPLRTSINDFAAQAATRMDALEARLDTVEAQFTQQLSDHKRDVDASLDAREHDLNDLQTKIDKLGSQIDGMIGTMAHNNNVTAQSIQRIEESQQSLTRNIHDSLRAQNSIIELMQTMQGRIENGIETREIAIKKNREEIDDIVIRAAALQNMTNNQQRAIDAHTDLLTKISETMQNISENVDSLIADRQQRRALVSGVRSFVSSRPFWLGVTVISASAGLITGEVQQAIDSVLQFLGG